MSEALVEGARVGPYTIRARIGVGASAWVYEAIDERGGRVALKVLRDEARGELESVERMKREAAVLRAIDHRAIVKVLADGALDDGRPWIALRIVEGETLRALIARGAIDRDPARAWALLRPVCEGLAVVHGSGVIHRDVKPENIIVHDGRACLVDFGLARSADPSQTALTGPGVALGTPAYMAPELWWNADVTASVDQYSVACVLYELLTGAPPFASDSFGGWMEAHMHGAVRPIERPELSAEARGAMDALFRTALGKDRGARFVSMDAFVREADRVFARAESARLISWSLFIPLVAALGPALVGHGDTRSPFALFRLAGYGAWLILACTVVAAVAAARRSALTMFAGAGAALLGLLGAATGWTVVLAAVERAAPEGRFTILHQGWVEADVNRAMGYWVAWGAAIAALLARGRSRVRRAGWIAVALLLAALLLLLSLDASSAALCVTLTLISVAVAASRERASRDDALAVLVLGSLAVLAAAAASLVAHGSAQAQVWNASLDRALRVARLTALAREGSLLVVSWALSLMAVAFVAVERWRSLRWTHGASRAARAWAPIVGLALTVGGLDLAQRARVSAARERARASLAGQFALFSRLDLVSMSGLPTPHVAPSVQLAQDVVAIDGVAVVRASALGAPSVRATLAQDLSHRLARERATSEHGPRWTLAVDQRAPFARVRAVLATAREVGAGPCELLFERGARPQWSVWAPVESALLVPADYGAIELRYEPTDASAIAIEDGARFSEVAPLLRARASASGLVLVR
ncbi:MAG: serine/threonine-protein kinase [Polyangiales bacterium]